MTCACRSLSSPSSPESPPLWARRRFQPGNQLATFTCADNALSRERAAEFTAGSTSGTVVWEATRANAADVAANPGMGSFLGLTVTEVLRKRRAFKGTALWRRKGILGVLLTWRLG